MKAAGYETNHRDQWTSDLNPPINESSCRFLYANHPLLATVGGVVAVVFLAYRLLLGQRPDLGKGHRFLRHLAILGLLIAGTLAIMLALPVSDSTRNQIIALIGMLLSGVVAFSSTTIIANFMAGFVLRMTRAFRTGDFIRINELFGRERRERNATRHYGQSGR